MIFVTGGAGFIGSHFVLQSNDAVVNLDKLTYAANLNHLRSLEHNVRHTFIHGDILDAALLQMIFQKYQPKAVVHFAAETHVDRSIDHPDNFIQTNVVGTHTLLKAALHYWESLSGEAKKAFRFLHVSTDEVYGSLAMDASSSREGDPYLPNSPYSASKAASDHLVRAYHKTYGLPTLITHASNNFGPHQYPEKLIPVVIQRALDEAVIPIYGDGTHVRNWIYVEDHCSALRTILEKGAVGESYNIGGSIEKSNREIVLAICALLDHLKPNSVTYSSFIKHVKDRPGHDHRYSLDSTKIKALGWKEQDSFEANLRKTVAWYLSQNRVLVNA